MRAATLAAAALTGAALVHAAPVGWKHEMLEDYDVYHLRYLALDCQTQHDTSFFSECCRPLKADQNVTDRAEYCQPNATAVESASARIASKTAAITAGAPTAPAAADAAATTTATDNDDAGAEWVEAATANATTATATATDSTATPASTTVEVVADAADVPATTEKAQEQQKQAEATTTTTEQPKQTEQAQENKQENKQETTSAAPGGAEQGRATFYSQGGQAGACGDHHSDSEYVVALNNKKWYTNINSKSEYCGRTITINGPKGQINALVADACPTCDADQIDLSIGAFNALGNPVDGIIPITWWFN